MICFQTDAIVIFLLDTTAISALMREDTRTASWLSSLHPKDRVVTCAIVRGEILLGPGRLAQRRRRAELEAKAQKLFAALRCEPIPPAAGDLYASVQLAQQRLGLSLDENDPWMAATALAFGATLVSSDRGFQYVEMLTVVVPLIGVLPTSRHAVAGMGWAGALQIQCPSFSTTTAYRWTIAMNSSGEGERQSASAAIT